MSDITRADEPVTSKFASVAPADLPISPSPAHGDVERLLESIIALAADAVVSTDESQRIIIFNPAAERIFGYRRAEVLGEPIDVLLPRSARNARLEGFRDTTADGDKSEHGRVWGRRKSGELAVLNHEVAKDEIVRVDRARRQVGQYARRDMGAAQRVPRRPRDLEETGDRHVSSPW